MTRKKILQAIETICKQGCREVNIIIELLEDNQQTEHTLHLTTDEKIAVLHELKGIMAVYKKGK